MNEILKQLDKTVKEIWEKEPYDVKKNKEETVGAYKHTGPVILYGESETREMIDYLWYVRSLTLSESIDLASAKTIFKTFLNLKGDKWSRWYKWERMPEFLNKAIEGIEKAKDVKELIKVIDLVMQGVGRFNFWLDAQIPWLTLSSVYDFTLQGR